MCVCVWHRKGEMYLKLIVNNGHTFAHSHIALPQSQYDSNECSHHKQATEHQDNDGLRVQSSGVHIALQLREWLEEGGRDTL